MAEDLAESLEPHQVPPRAARPRTHTRGLDQAALEALTRAMAARSWRIADLGREAGISESAAWKVVRGRTVSPETLAAVARAISRSRHQADPATLLLLNGELE